MNNSPQPEQDRLCECGHSLGSHAVYELYSINPCECVYGDCDCSGFRPAPQPEKRCGYQDEIDDAIGSENVEEALMSTEHGVYTPHSPLNGTAGEAGEDYDKDKYPTSWALRQAGKAEERYSALYALCEKAAQAMQDHIDDWRPVEGYYRQVPRNAFDGLVDALSAFEAFQK